jgi:hypothetical protein
MKVNDVLGEQNSARRGRVRDIMIIIRAVIHFVIGRSRRPDANTDTLINVSIRWHALCTRNMIQKAFLLSTIQLIYLMTTSSVESKATRKWQYFVERLVYFGSH